MAKKKKSQRKRNFSYSSSKPNNSRLAQPNANPQKPAVTAVKPDSQPATSKLQYLGHDIKTIAILASACILLEAMLWVLLQHTGLGTKVFGL